MINLTSATKLSRLSLAADSEKPISILVVEDSKTVRRQLRQQISLLENVTVFEAGTLAEARNVLEAQSDDIFCAVLDLTLPDASGLDVVEAVRAYKVPSIVLTGSADPFLRQAVLDLRVIDYMFKTGAMAIEDVAYLIGRLRQNQAMIVLVVDDSKTFRTHVSGLLAQYRFVTMTANNGQEALEVLEKHPDIALVLTDYHMPEMNGLELIRNIRRTHRREDLAIIAMSDLDRPELSAAMLKAGANDFLHKGFQVEEFYCRVVQNTNMVRFVCELRRNSQTLQTYHDEREAENQLAVEIIEQLMNRPGLSDPALHYWMHPATYFSGDIVAAARSEDGRFSVLLADATGHGLGAAISVLPVMTLFYDIIDANLPMPMEHVIAEINNQLRGALPIGRFVACTYVCIDPKEGRCQLWIGGMPNALMVGDEGRVLYEISSSNCALGIDDMDLRKSAAETLVLPAEGAQLVMFSDGLIEAENVNGEGFGLERLCAAISGVPPAGRLNAVKDAVFAFLGERQPHDDITVLFVDLPRPRQAAGK